MKKNQVKLFTKKYNISHDLSSVKQRATFDEKIDEDFITGLNREDLRENESFYISSLRKSLQLNIQSIKPKNLATIKIVSQAIFKKIGSP